MRFCVPALCHSTLVLIIALSNVFSAKGGDINGTMNYDGKTRTYLLHVPPNYNPSVPIPLLLAFHGLTGDGALMADITQFSPLADQENFIVVYPDGLAQKWSGPNGSTDDVGFISALIDLLHTSYNIDGARTFAAGASNGGMFTYRLGLGAR
jgi:polyhydroxybutyrate depolymerase